MEGVTQKANAPEAVVEGRVPMTLVCWTCGNKQSGLVRKLPQFAFEFALIVEDAGWIAGWDMKRDRVLPFCTKTCQRAAMTKTGAYRAKPPKPKKVDPDGQ